MESTHRFLTTHTGSLPRPDDLVSIMYAKEEGQNIDHAELGERIHAAVAEVMAKQRKAGIDIINDGEVSKPSYATYVKDRLSGFGGTGNTFVYQDLVEFPNLAKRVFGDPGRSRRKTPACNGPIRVSDDAAVRIDVENLRSTLGTNQVQRAFISAASPGVVSPADRHIIDIVFSARPSFVSFEARESPARCGPSALPRPLCRITHPRSLINRRKQNKWPLSRPNT